MQGTHHRTQMQFLSLDVARPETWARITGSEGLPIAYGANSAMKNKATLA
jgi:hypothetical protein